MPVSGLVVTLSSDAALATRAQSWLRRRSEVELGEQQGHRLPIVTEAASAAAAHDLHDAIRALPGVVEVDVTFVAYEDDADSPRAGAATHHPESSHVRGPRAATEVLP